MDINKIFGSFGSSSRDDGWEPRGYNYTNPRTLPEIDENHPRYYVKMFVKLILNYRNYSKKLINFFGSADPELNIRDIEEAGDSMLFERAYSYIKEIDLQDKYHIKIIFQEATPELEEALNKSLKFYENQEEYEKCIILKKYLDFLNFSS